MAGGAHASIRVKRFSEAYADRLVGVRRCRPADMNKCRLHCYRHFSIGSHSAGVLRGCRGAAVNLDRSGGTGNPAGGRTVPNDKGTIAFDRRIDFYQG